MFIDIHTLSISIGRKDVVFKNTGRAVIDQAPPDFYSRCNRQTGRLVWERPRERGKRCRACPLRKDGGFKAFL